MNGKIKPPTVRKREQKKAQQKVDIMNAFIKDMEMKNLHEIRVEDICQNLGITKVTFFNYFHSKEQVVAYFVHLWEYEMSRLINKKNLNGKDSIYMLFENMMAHSAALHIMNAILMFFIKQEEQQEIEITDYEYYLYCPNSYDGKDPMNLADMLQRGLTELDIPKSVRQQWLTNMVIGFYGSAFVQNIGPWKGQKDIYKGYLEGIFQGIKDAKEGKDILTP